MKIEFSGSTILFTLLWMVLGYFIYGNMIGALAMGLIYLVISTIMIISLIPIIGWIFAICLNHFIVIPEILNLTGLHHTWIIYIIEGVSYLMGFMLTVFAILCIISFIIGYIIK